MTSHLKDHYDVIIAGAGPAGSSAAIQLAQHSLSVLLIEQKRFPRPKLCGEFISPECFSHFERLGVAEPMIRSNPATLRSTVFYSSRGHRVSVPSSWFGGGLALGLSRATMDNNLFVRAQAVGVDVLEEAVVTDVIEEQNRIQGVRVKTSEGDRDYEARLTIDATGRPRILTRRLQPNHRSRKPPFVAFKTHLSGALPEENVCEIYSYPGGYGGLNTIENGLSNLCFIVSARDVRRFNSDADTVMNETVMRNRRAACALSSARRHSEWLSVSLERFGFSDPAPKPGLIAIGDAASFIDPFTGSGMLMALESGELAATVAVAHFKNHSSIVEMRNDYLKEYHRKFSSRFRVSSLLRRTAFNPRLAEMTIIACSLNTWLRNQLARATRSRVDGTQSTVSMS